MLTAIEGTYENGQITLMEKPPFGEKAKVIVTFLSIEKKVKKLRPFGLMKGKIRIADDFDEPLEELKDYM